MFRTTGLLASTTNRFPSNVFMVDHKILYVHVVYCSTAHPLFKTHLRVGFYVLCTAVVLSATTPIVELRAAWREFVLFLKKY
jgi:hypothetical protein